MKRILAILLIAILILSLFACNSDTSVDTGTPVSGGDTSPTTSSAATPGSSPSQQTTPPSNNGGEAANGDKEIAASPDGVEYGGVMRVITTSEGAQPIGVPWEVTGVDANLQIPTIESVISQKLNGEVVPVLAESVVEDYENLKIIITVRQNVDFIDGSHLNAEVVAWNYEMSKEANRFSTQVTDIEVTGEYEVVLHLEAYTNEIIGVLSGNGIISKESFEKNGIEWARDNPVGTGAFKLSEFVRGSHISYVRNDNYWQPGKPYLDGMEYVFIRDVMTQNIAMQSTGTQSIDVLNSTNSEQIVLMRQMGYNVVTIPIGPTSLIPSSKVEGSPLADLRVRQAISYAIDRDALVAARGFGLLQPAGQIVSDLYPAYLPESYTLTYDLDKAKELMIEAGYPDGFSTTLIGQPGLADRDMVVAMQAMLARIGITAAVEFPDSGGYAAIRTAGWDGFLVAHIRSMTNIGRTFHNVFGPFAASNSAMWKPDGLEDLILLTAALPIGENTQALLDTHKMVLDNMVAIPVVYLYDAWISKSNLHGAGFGEWATFRPADAWFSSD